DGLPIGQIAPPIEGATARGEPTTWRPSPGRMQLLAFVSPTCEPCEHVIPVISRLAAQHREIDVALVVSGGAESALRLERRFSPACPCIAQTSQGLYNNYLVRVTPFAFVVGGDGKVRSKGLCSDVSRLQQVLHEGGLRLSQAVPAITLPLASQV